MNEAIPDSASHNKVSDSEFCNELIHLEFCIHKSSLILQLIPSLIHTLMRILEGHFGSL